MSYDIFHLRSKNVCQKDSNAVSFSFHNLGANCLAFGINMIVRYLKLSIKFIFESDVKKEKKKLPPKLQKFDRPNSRILRTM